MHANAGGRRLASGAHVDERRTFVMGGPFADNSGSLSLLEGVSVDEAKRIIAEDPFVENGVFVLDDVREWDVLVDELTGRGAKSATG